MGTGYDRSAQKEATRTRLTAALLKLADQNKGQKITVQQVCQLAGVNRSTFYAHFRDLYDIVEYVTNYLSNELSDLLSRQRDAGALTTDMGISIIVSHTYAHRYFYRIHPLSHVAQPYEKLHLTGHNLWQEYLIAPKCLAAGIIDPVEIEYYTIHFHEGMSCILGHWLKGGCRESPEQMARILRACFPSLPPGNRGEGGRLP